MLGHAYTLVPAPLGRPYHRLRFTIVWTDGYELTDAVDLSDALVREDCAVAASSITWCGATRARSPATTAPPSCANAAPSCCAAWPRQWPQTMRPRIAATRVGRHLGRTVAHEVLQW